ncbi:MAG: hypothetical protein WCX65_13210 [bacterium]
MEKSYIWFDTYEDDFIWVSLTNTGYNKIYDILSKDPRLSSMEVFVALEFKNKDIYENVIKNVLDKDFEFTPVCMLDHSRSVNIDDAINAGIRNSRFIIVDLTGKNAGAYWEAGFGFGLGKEVILCCKKEEGKEIPELVHFDQNHFSILFYETDGQLKEGLKNRIKSIPGLIP